jgi:hypothetical protein
VACRLIAWHASACPGLHPMPPKSGGATTPQRGFTTQFFHINETTRSPPWTKGDFQHSGSGCFGKGRLRHTLSKVMFWVMVE